MYKEEIPVDYENILMNSNLPNVKVQSNVQLYYMIVRIYCNFVFLAGLI